MKTRPKLLEYAVFCPLNVCESIYLQLKLTLHLFSSFIW